MNTDRHGPHRATLEEILPLRTRVLRPQFGAGELAHFEGDSAPGSCHFAFFEDNMVLGVLSIMEAVAPEQVPDSDQPALQLRGMAVAPEAQGQGVGTRLLNFAVTATALQHPHTRVMWCNARESAIPFYRSAGWAEVGDYFDVSGIGPHRVMYLVMPLMLA